MLTSIEIYQIFENSVLNYHRNNSVDTQPLIPYNNDSIQYILFKKNWIDNIQWHLEDLIRDPDIECKNALVIKKRIDKLNQERTDIVELIDDFFAKQYSKVIPNSNAQLNTESLGWAIDKLSILALKIYHINVELTRDYISSDHRMKCSKRYELLMSQKHDLFSAINFLVHEIEMGQKIYKVYRQFKMYNDPELNPVLYNKQRF